MKRIRTRTKHQVAPKAVARAATGWHFVSHRAGGPSKNTVRFAAKHLLFGRQVVEAFGWKKGDYLELALSDDLSRLRIRLVGSTRTPNSSKISRERANLVSALGLLREVPDLVKTSFVVPAPKNGEAIIDLTQPV